VSQEVSKEALVEVSEVVLEEASDEASDEVLEDASEEVFKGQFKATMMRYRFSNI
jgi:hypothetical protein